MTNDELQETEKISFDDFIKLIRQREYDIIRPLLESKDFDANNEDIYGGNLIHFLAGFEDLKVINMIFKYQPHANINARHRRSMMTPLMMAAMRGRTDALVALLKNGADTSCQDASGNTALMLASKAGHEKCVKILLKTGNCNVKVQNVCGANALMLSVNHLEIVKKLIKDYDITQVDVYGCSVLHWACQSAPLSVFKLLLAEPGIRINQKNFNGVTPLHYAIQHNRLGFARILIENGANLLEKDYSGLTPFQYAAIYDKTEEFLQNFKCEEKSEIDDTFILSALFGRLGTLKSLILMVNTEVINQAFIAAAKGGRLECIKLLFEAENFEPSTVSFVEALISALKVKQFTCFEYVYKSIMDDQPEDFKNECLLHQDEIIWTAFSSGCIEACKLFLADGLEPNGSHPITFLMAASCNGHLEVATLLLEHGADFNRKNEMIGSALLLGVTSDHLEIVKKLLEKGADTSISDEKGFTPLISAAFHGYIEVFFEVFKANQNVQERTKDGLTTFLAACISGQLEIVRALITFGVKIDEIDHQMNNCLHLAAENSKDTSLFVYLIGKVDNLIELITSPNMDGETPLDFVIKNQNLSLLFNDDLIAKTGIKDLIEGPYNFEIKTIDNHTMCLICRDYFVVEDCATKLPCNHLFHESCYSPWSITKANCPYCQKFPYKVKSKNRF